MRKKYAVLLLGAALGLSLLIGCKGTEKDRTVSRVIEDDNAIYGEVSQVSDHGITIKVGTRKERGQSEEEKPSRDNAGEMPSMLELTGEEQEIPVTDETVIKQQFMGGGRGNRGENTEMPDLPPGEQTPGEKPEGEMPKGQMPDGERPEGEIPDWEPNGEEITLADISQGDTIAVVLTEDGDAQEIQVLFGKRQENMNPDAQSEEDETV